jgi:hypothetical protein
VGERDQGDRRADGVVGPGLVSSRADATGRVIDAGVGSSFVAPVPNSGSSIPDGSASTVPIPPRWKPSSVPAAAAAAYAAGSMTSSVVRIPRFADSWEARAVATPRGSGRPGRAPDGTWNGNVTEKSNRAVWRAATAAGALNSYQSSPPHADGITHGTRCVGTTEPAGNAASTSAVRSIPPAIACRTRTSENGRPRPKAR